MRIKPIAFLTILFIHNAYSEDLAANYFFDPAFLNNGKNNINETPDLRYFSRAGGVLPGKYIVTVLVNGELKSQEEINFKPTESGNVEPEFEANLLKRWGIDIERFDSLKSIYSNEELISTITGFTSEFNTNNQTLSLSIPQKWIYSPEWSQVPPQSWDHGETALLSNYRYSSLNSRYKSKEKQSQSLSINSALNISGWRIRHNGYWNSDARGWDSINTFARHDYNFWQGGQFTIGQTSTDDGIFNSFPFEGASLSSDDGMIVPMLTSYTPTIRGVANTPAQITVRQNNTIIWQGDVPAGPFELRDIYPLYSGDMNVEIRESNGEVRYFNQTSATLPILQHKGRLRYNAAIGRYRDTGKSHKDQPSFIQSSLAWGLGWDATIYGGLIAANDYNSMIFGVGKYMSTIGALSLDMSSSEAKSLSQHNAKKEHGYVTRLMFTKGFETFGTQFNLASHLYSGSNYYTFNDYQQSKKDEIYLHGLTQRSKLSAQLIQSIGSAGQINLATQWDDYINASDGQQYRLTYSLPIKSVFTSFSLNYNKQPYYNNVDRSIYTSISIPFSAFSNYTGASLSTSLYNSGNNTTIQSGVSGSFLDQTLYYSVMEGVHKGDEDASSGNAFVRYRSSKGEAQSSWSHQKNSRQFQLGAAGGITLHKEGLTFSQTLSLDAANALVDTNGVGDIKVKKGIGIFTDHRGFAVVPNLAPYQNNAIALDVTKVNDTTEIIKSDTIVTPSRGALVSAKFDVASGYKALINLVQENGVPVPLGSIATLSTSGKTSKNSSFVSDKGQVWMSGLSNQGVIKAQWGDDIKRNCKAPFNLNNVKNEIIRLTLVCK